MEVTIVSALWCPSCLVLKKHIKRLNKEYDINIRTLDYDFDEEIVKELNVGKVLPVIIVNDGDNEINRLIGEKTYDEIIEFLKDCNVL